MREMDAHWSVNLGNATSPALRELWRIVANTFNKAILNQDNKWRVLEPATGTGKTQSIVVYSAQMATLNASSDRLARTGILVVVRTIKQADELVAAINARVGKSVSVARHSENRTNTNDCQLADVLVITHSAYQSAISGVYRGSSERWFEYVDWLGGKRCLTIIDEALGNIVEHHEVNAQDIRKVLAVCDKELRQRHMTQINALERLVTTLDYMEFAGRAKEGMLWKERPADEEIYWPRSMSMGSLIEEIRRLPLDLDILHRSDPRERLCLCEQFVNTLQSCDRILCGWAYYRRSGDWRTLNHAELLIPVDLPGPVVLDATASQNMLWELLGDLVERPVFPSRARSYRNVRLHVAYARGLGKESMEKKGKERLPRLFAHLERSCTSLSVLLCAHKHLEPFARTLAPSFHRYDVAHWGAIDGKNDWQDYDTVVIFGLPYHGDVWAFRTFMALQGPPEDDSWFESPTWRQYQHIQKSLDRKQVTVSLIQAVNRIRCRRVLNQEGDCPTSDIYLLLPEGREGLDMLEDIRLEMPDISVVGWDFVLDGAEGVVRRHEGYEPLIRFMQDQQPGSYAMSQIRDALGWTSNKMKEVGRVLRDCDHHVTRKLAALGVVVSTNHGRGRGAQTCLVKV
ncbi:hypothetical protein [Aquamicrobium zhengzhouense]|uniref:Helicase ATP-binding domain-containing protein n=1 Tax=Aquamicrobium zhengzhouense TaxID=2781738 RepID=A0ABS0SB62_9HYPH|nr:hypothetical protein [Aquamicrobium zhengzhouense]MBI1619673.1 hypothetical protein [Aquamicrobium zhengzhouense]